MAGRFNPGGTARRAPAPPAAARPKVEMPEIVELGAQDARPAILLQGGSGTGKTHGLGQLLKSGKKGLILAVEPKVQTLMKYNPKVLFLGQPVKEGGKLRPPNERELYERLMRFRDNLAAGAYREHQGEPIDFIGIDGFLEMGEVIYKHWKAVRPTAASTGSKDTFALWDNVAEKSVDFFKSLRDAAGMAATSFGLPPIGTIATIGEDDVEELGATKHVPLFPGKKAGKILPYCFEVVLRLSVRNTEGEVQYIAHTVAQNDPTAMEKFYAKVPSGLFPQEIINPDLGEIYDKVVKDYNTISVEDTTDE